MSEAIHALVVALADGRFHSGASLASHFNVSRTAIWKRIRRLMVLGMDIERVRGQGYRLSAPLDLLDSNAIESSLAAASLKQIAQLDVLPVVGSTNGWLAERTEQLSLGAAAVCLAECQTAGRGRRGRAWISPFGASLYLSVGWHLHDLPPSVGALGLAAGIAVAQVLARNGVSEVGLKWPNDIFHRGRKLGGILVDLQGQPGGAARIVIGVGINVSMPLDAADRVDQPWIDLAGVGLLTDGLRNGLAVALIDALLTMMRRFAECGFRAFLDAWDRFDAVAGRVVTLQMEKESVTGIVTGVDEQGALCLKAGAQQRRFFSGEVRLQAVDIQ